MALSGPHPISQAALYVYANAIGVYMFSVDGRSIRYVGRSVNDLGDCIVRSAGEERYTHFWFDYSTSPLQAYTYECELYHQYQPPDNTGHPAVPRGMNWRCPIQGCPGG